MRRNLLICIAIAASLAATSCDVAPAKLDSYRVPSWSVGEWTDGTYSVSIADDSIVLPCLDVLDASFLTSAQYWVTSNKDQYLMRAEYTEEDVEKVLNLDITRVADGITVAYDVTAGGEAESAFEETLFTAVQSEEGTL